MKKVILSLLFLTIFGAGFLFGINSSKSSVANNESILGRNDVEEKADFNEEIYSDEDDENIESNLEIEINEDVEYDVEEESFKNNMKSKKDEFLDTLNKLEVELKDSLKDKYDSEITSDMIEAFSTECEKWDDMLNEIYEYLSENLSEEDVNILKSEQLDWIKLKDEKAKESNDEFSGGSFAAVNEMSVLKEIIKERCYELVNVYFD